MKVKVTKILDDKFNDNHPNKINTGYEKTGDMINSELRVGECVMILTLGTWFSTSPIEEIIDNSTFKTANSTYKIEYL